MTPGTGAVSFYLQALHDLPIRITRSPGTGVSDWCGDGLLSRFRWFPVSPVFPVVRNRFKENVIFILLEYLQSRCHPGFRRVGITTALHNGP